MSNRGPIRLFFLGAILFGVNQKLKAQPGKFASFADSLISIFQTTKDDSVKALTALNIAQAKMGEAQNTGKWDEPIKWATKGVYYSKKANFKFGIRRCNWQLGQCWMRKGDYAETHRYFTESLNASLQHKAITPIVNMYSWVGKSLILLGDYQEALKNLQAGFKICEDHYAELNNINKVNIRNRLIMFIGDCYLKLNKYSEAITWYEKLNADNQQDSLGIAYVRIASAQMETKNYDAAVKNLQTAIQFLPNLLKLQPDIEYEGVLGEFYMQIGEAYCKLGFIKKNTERINIYKEAVIYLNKSLPLLRNGAGGKENLMEAYAFLTQACEGINDYQNALLYTNLYDHLKDSIYNKASYLKLADQQTKFEMEKATALLEAKQEKERIEQQAFNDKRLADQKLEEEKKLSAQKTEQEKKLAIASEKANYEKAMAVEKIRAEKQQANNLLLMGLILVAMTSIFVILYLRQRHQKKIAVEKAEAVHKMAELELQSLRAQLNPHFMFNSLNSLQRLILMEESDKSQSYLARFSKMLRTLLDNADKPFISLQKEVDFLQLYLGLEQLRLPDLQYSIYTDPSLNTEYTLIPNMILQPYVENAIWHGLSHKENDKRVQVRIYREKNMLNCEIEDNGVGRKKAEELKSLFRKQHQSKGMELLSKRFKLLNEEFGSSIQATVTDKRDDNRASGTLVSIQIPVMQTA